MKITDIKAIPLYIPAKETVPFSLTAGASAYHVLVKVFTDEGITGYGEAFRFTPQAVSIFIQEALKPHLVKQDPTQIERLWDIMYRTSFRWGRKGLAITAISGVEIALWDILGKYRGLPVYEMLGGLCRPSIRAYASLHRYEKPEDVATISLRCVEQGYTAVKLHQRDMASVKAVRQAVGHEVVLMVDVNGAWTPKEAARKAKELEEYGVLWLEEPVSPMDDYEGLAYVRANSNMLIAGGENEYTRFGFKELITRQAVDIIQPDVIKAGGILECRKIFALAEAWNLQIALHSFGFGPGFAATLHLSLSNLKSEYVEVNALPLKVPFMQPSLRPKDGYLKLPDKPGLGIEIDEKVVKKHPYAGQYGQ